MVAHEAKRIAQTPGAFSNWPAVLSDLARERLGGGPETLTFLTRSGRRMSCPNKPGARVPIYEMFAEDCYRLAWFLGPLLSRRIHALDIGAHVGTFACWFTSVHPQVTIDCYEPSATTSGFLRRNVEQNGLGDRITVHESALAGEPGWATFDDNGAGSGMNGLVQGGATASRGTATKVATETFDEAVATASAPVEFVKMDTEGGEYDLVYASSPQSWSTVRRLVLEYHDIPGQSWGELRDWFAAVGLTVIRQEPVTANLGTAWLSREAEAPTPATS